MNNDHSEDPPQTDPNATAPKDRRWFDSVAALFDKWRLVLVALGALLAAAANVNLFVEQQWRFAIVLMVLCLAGLSLSVLSGHAFASARQKKLLRLGAAIVLTSIPVVTVAVFYFLAFAPRTAEDGPILAIAQFAGPQLPAPYGNCRPSDMLADTLSDVTRRYAHLTAFELPYVIDPTGRWAPFWARLHGIFEGADTVVYGEYSFVDDKLREQKPDRIRISPQVGQIPTPPLASKMAPLQGWEFPDRIVRIEDLCTGHAQRFLHDGERLGLALAGLQAFDDGEFVSAERALAEAETSQDPSQNLFPTAGAADDSTCDTRSPEKSQCSGVLAFYLASLEQRMGHYAIAEREYAFAAAKLNRPAPFIDLAQLYALQNRGPEVLRALRSAESADPDSIVAAATRAEYEHAYGTDDEAGLELDRAAQLVRERREKPEKPSEYEQIALCRALYIRDRTAGLACRATVPNAGFERSPGARVENARWLIATGHADLIAQAIGELHEVVRIKPYSIAANYTLARALAGQPGADPVEIRDCYLRALNARAFTDEEFTDQGNAAADINDFANARDRYAKALIVNPNFAYAYSNRSALYYRSKDPADQELAIRDAKRAAQLHPREFSPPGQGALTETAAPSKGERVSSRPHSESPNLY